MTNKQPYLSIVIPVFNEAENIEPLAQWIARELKSCKYTWEAIFIDDGSQYQTWQKIKQVSHQYPNFKGVKLLRNYGKSAALSVGFKLASGSIIVTMDGDLQDSPEEIIPLVEKLLKENLHIVSGWKKERKDPLSKKLPSKIFNLVVRLTTGIKLHDFNCGLKAYRAYVAKMLNPQGEMHRYLPVLAHYMGFKRIGEKPVKHYPRIHGKSKFGAERFIRGFLDLLTVLFLTRFGKRPMHLFGTWGLLFFLIGVGIGAYLSYLKIVLNVVGISSRPLFFLGILCIIFGAQLFLTGFLAELIIRQIPQDPLKTYLIEEKTNI